MAWDAEPPALGAGTVRAEEAMRLQVSFEPEQAQAIVKQLGDGKINHTVLTANRTVDRRQYTTPARLPDMSHPRGIGRGVARYAAISTRLSRRASIAWGQVQITAAFVDTDEISGWASLVLQELPWAPLHLGGTAGHRLNRR